MKNKIGKKQKNWDELIGEEVLDAPRIVQYLWVASMTKTPVGMRALEIGMRDHPEYFQKEIAHRAKWDSIPKEVHEGYLKELMDFRKDLWKDEPKSGGLVSMINNTEEYRKFDEACQRLKPIEEAKEEEIHKKYYSGYGIEYRRL